MKNKILFLASLSLIISFASGCNNNKACVHMYDEFFVSTNSKWRTYITGTDFNEEGLSVSVRCSKCGQTKVVDYTLENNTSLEKGQDHITIKHYDLTLDYPITVKDKYHIACIGDSLTAGHMWANESYPTKLSGLVSENYEVGNFGVNGISITGYGGSWDDPEMRYIKQDVYTNSVNFSPDIFAIMLGTNDATGWEKAKDTFDDYYHILLDSYIEQFPNARFIMMISPPVVSPNQFNIPNDTIRDEINPRQRDLVDEYDFEILDLREEFEATPDYQSKFLRPNNDNVHFTVEGAEFVAGRVWDIAKDLTF